MLSEWNIKEKTDYIVRDNTSAIKQRFLNKNIKIWGVLPIFVTCRLVVVLDSIEES